jgi:hypothetical protein
MLVLPDTSLKEGEVIVARLLQAIRHARAIHSCHPFHTSARLALWNCTRRNGARTLIGPMPRCMSPNRPAVTS